jgi:hypothetical protein
MKELEQYNLDQILKHLMDNIDVEDLLKQITNKDIVNYVTNNCFTFSEEEKMVNSFDVSTDLSDTDIDELIDEIDQRFLDRTSVQRLRNIIDEDEYVNSMFDQMKRDYFFENFDKISLKDLENICENK